MKEQQKRLQYSYEAEVVAAWREQLAEAAEKPWLASVLLEHGERILRRFVHFYQRLRALPRRARRHIQRKLALGLGAAALLLALSSIQAPLAYGNSINVAAGVVDDTDAQCSLIEAIENANDTTDGLVHDDCAAGDPAGADTINLPAGSTFTLNDTTGALPAITTNITIEGNGATIERDSGAAKFRIFAVNATGDLTLNEATISGGDVTDMHFSGGGVYNAGTLTINDSTISGNTANGGGGVLNIGAVTINNSTISGNDASDGGGGGVYNLAGVYFNHSIVSGNTATFAGNEVSGAVNADDHNLFGHSGETDYEAFDGFAPTGLTDINATSDGGGTPTALGAILDPLADNGGPTETHALVPGSPAIEAGDTCESTDQRGEGRPMDYKRDDTATCDIGAFELQSDENFSISLTGVSDEQTFGATLVKITRKSGDPGTVSVTKYNQPPGGGSPDENEMRIQWNITASGTYDLDLKLCYTDWEVTQGNSVTEANLKMYRWSGSAWVDQGTVTVDTINNCVTLLGVTSLSDWTLGDGPPNGGPTAVTLASFGAETVPVDKVGLLAPWMGLAGLVATAVAAVAARLRRSKP